MKWLIALVVVLIGGCANTPATPGLSKAERLVGVVQVAVTNLQAAEHQIATEATARGDTATAAKATKIEKAAIQALPYFTIAKDGLSAVRGDPQAQVRILNDLVIKVGGTDPSIVAIASILPPLIQELVNESRPAPSP